MQNVSVFLEKGKIKKIVLILSSFLIVLLGIIKSNGTGAQAALASNLFGVAFLPFILFRFKLKDFIRWSYIVGLGIWAVAFCVFKDYFFLGNDYDSSIICAWVNVLIYGLLVIRMIYSLNEKREFSVKFGLSFVWVLMFAFCIASKNKSIWPLWYFVMFGSFYWAPLKKEELRTLMSSAFQGIILSFFVFQGYSLLRRPFDSIRYKGIMTNTNITAMFFFLCYLACLGELSRARKEEKKGYFWMLFLTASSLWAFAFFSVCRTVIVAFILVTIAYWLVEEFCVYKTGIGGFVKKGILMFCVFAICIPIVYFSIRYIPAIVHHPKFFPNDGYNPESQVTAEDSFDSKKYTSFNESVSYFFGRFDSDNTEYKSSEVSMNDKGEVVNPSTLESITLAKAEICNGDRVYKYADGVEPGSDPNHPIFNNLSYSGLQKILDLRYYIYKYSFSEIRFWGNSEYKGGYIIPTFFLYHTHNSFLQMTICFGILPGLFFLTLVIYSICVSTKLVIYEKENNWIYIFSLTMGIGFFIISIFECLAIPGHFLFTLFFFSLLPCMLQEKN